MKKILLTLLFPVFASAQGYTSYFTGNTTNITTIPEFGICMMGGATEHDNAMTWLLEKANGGDIVVLRSSGSDGYNDYLYSELGVNVNSVETLVITSIAGATNPYVLDKVANAEMIWFAGGDQYNYVSYFKDNALEDLINAHINVKHAPIGGTSAGMAILGGKYFSAQNGSVTSVEALANPFHPNVTIGQDDFLHIPFLESVITDTHYDNPDRRGRQTAFMARLKTANPESNVYGIACNEYVAVCVDTLGLAHVYGDYPNYQEFAYFLQASCEVPNTNSAPEICQANTPLTWNYDGLAVKAYKVPGTMNGTNYFDLKNWSVDAHFGGEWQNWSVNNGVLSMVTGAAPICLLANEDFNADMFQATPNPFSNSIQLEGLDKGNITIYNAFGQTVYASAFTNSIDTTNFSVGLYFLKIEDEGKTEVKKMIKQ